MISNIITYLIIGVALNLIYDWAVNSVGAEYRFTFKERVIVTLIWPFSVIIFIYHFIKSMLDGEF